MCFMYFMLAGLYTYSVVKLDIWKITTKARVHEQWRQFDKILFEDNLEFDGNCIQNLNFLKMN